MWLDSSPQTLALQRQRLPKATEIEDTFTSLDLSNCCHLPRHTWEMPKGPIERRKTPTTQLIGGPESGAAQGSELVFSSAEGR